MNFKKITTIIEGSLKKEIENNAEIRYSPGMFAACDFAGKILSYNFASLQMRLSSRYYNEKVFCGGNSMNRFFDEAFEKCSRINVELSRAQVDFISVRMSFYEKSKKESILSIEAFVRILDGSLVVPAMEVSNVLLK